jgi:hypothetical protein
MILWASLNSKYMHCKLCATLYTVNVFSPISPKRSQVKSYVKCVKCEVHVDIRVHAVSLAPKSVGKDQSLGRIFSVNSFWRQRLYHITRIWLFPPVSAYHISDSSKLLTNLALTLIYNGRIFGIIIRRQKKFNSFEMPFTCLRAYFLTCSCNLTVDFIQSYLYSKLNLTTVYSYV